MRTPSLHISQDHLTKLVNNFLDERGIGIPGELLVDYLMKHGKKYSLRHRSLLASNEKVARRSSKIQASPRLDAGLFASLAKMIRTRAGHKNVRIPTEKDGSQWDFLLQAAGLANEFCQTYGLDKKKGYTEYIQIAMKEMKPFSFNRFKAANERIIAHYECIREIEKDPNNDKTQLLYEIYQQKVLEKTGYSMDYLAVPTEYVHFVRATQCAKEVGLHPKHYVTAQFDQLDFTNGYPTPSQLDTFKAKERAIRWATENDIVKREKQKNLTKAQKEFMNKMMS